MKYLILSNHDQDSLQKEVNAKLEEGYEPLGGVQLVVPVIDEQPTPLFVQSMLKIKE